MLSRLRGKRTIENPTVPISSQEILKIFGISPGKSGVSVNEKTAMQNIAVFACIRILSETPASLPLLVYRRLPGGGKERATGHPTYPVLHDMANPEMTAMTLRETVQGHAVGWGNGYAYIVREDGWATELWPLLPDKTCPVRVNGEIVYRVTLPTGEQRTLSPLDVLHVPGFGFDGLQGYSPIRLAKEAIGLGLAAEEFGARFFGQGTNLGGVVEHPGKLGPQAHENLKSSLSQSYQGLGRSHLLMVLEEGMKYQKIGVDPDSAQFLETRKFEVTEIARLFRVPPHMIADLDKATFSNIEHQAIEFVVHTLRPWLVRWEQAINYKLFSPRERKEYFAEHLVDGLLRGDSKNRAEALSTLRQNGIINADEWREIENMNPQEGGTGKIYLVNAAMVSVAASAQTEPTPQGQARSIETRAEDSGAYARVRLAKAFNLAFIDAGQRIVRREKADIIKSGLKTLEERSIDRFERWLEDFYRNAPEWISKIMRPLAHSYAESVHVLAADEIGALPGMTRNLVEFVDKYVDSFALRYAASSAGQMRHVMQKAIEDRVDIAEAIQTRLSEWEERRPGKVAMNETIQAGNAVAMTVFIEAGTSRLRWVNTGSKTCIYCQPLDGRVVSIGNRFVHDGDTLLSQEGEMKVYRDTAHPPLHQGCRCMITPG
ncbi:MAG TPA: phage portal protein [Dissulfurispiraceae bacterium]|nr:phage portal protein [Dissulfurispiraceae bacterium]